MIYNNKLFDMMLNALTYALSTYKKSREKKMKINCKKKRAYKKKDKIRKNTQKTNNFINITLLIKITNIT